MEFYFPTPNQETSFESEGFSQYGVFLQRAQFSFMSYTRVFHASEVSLEIRRSEFVIAGELWKVRTYLLCLKIRRSHVPQTLPKMSNELFTEIFSTCSVSSAQLMQPNVE